VIYRFRAEDGEEIEREMSMHEAPKFDAIVLERGKQFKRVIEMPTVRVEHVDLLSWSAPMLTEAELQDPKIAKAKHYVKEPVTGLYRAGFRSEREKVEYTKKAGLILE